MRGLYKLLLGFLLLISTGVLAQCPPNIGFEDGSFNNWECDAGSIDPNGVITVGPTNPIYNRHVIIDSKIQSDEYDKYGLFPITSPNGSRYCVRLGNDSVHAQAERISYTFTVPAGSEYSLVLNYAVVLQNPTHAAYQQPKFTAQVFDITDNRYIDCPSFDFIASADLPGFKLSNITGDTSSNKSPSTIYYKDWSATTINLVGYGGKSVRLEFTTNDCTLGGHFGYAYLDIDQDCTQAITGNTYCAGQTSVTLHAPTGFYDYFWYTGDLKTQVGHGETLTIDPAPPDQTKYALTIVPYPGLGCPDTLYTTINKLTTAFNLKVADTVYGCAGPGANLTDPSVTAGSSSGLTLSYYTDPTGVTYLYRPQSVGEGTYYIKGVSPEGCQNIVPVQVVIHPRPAIGITDSPPVQYPGTVDLSTVFTPLNNVDYSYYTDANATIPIDNYKAVGKSGTYYIKGVDKTWGCETITYTTVQITPPPPYIIAGPNVFTPNGDGINDTFMITINGYVTFNIVRIFNRYGQLMYTAKSINDVWNGNYNGHPLPTGTYYWMFEGTDQYYLNRVVKGGAIAIVR